MKEEYLVYIIWDDQTRSFYTGITSEIKIRLKRHNQTNPNTKTTKNKHNYELIYCHCVEGRMEARRLEKYFKSGFGREIRQEMLESWLESEK